MRNEAHSTAVIRSKHCQDFLVDGHRFTVSIYTSEEHLGWCLDIIDEQSMSHGWSVTFETEREALEAALIALADEGAAGFLQPGTPITTPKHGELRIVLVES